MKPFHLPFHAFLLAALLCLPSTTTLANNGSAAVITVAKGDTLSVLARRHGSSVAALRQANGLTGDLIQLGQRLIVPKASSVKTPATPVPRLVKINAKQQPAAIHPALLARAAQGNVSVIVDLDQQRAFLLVGGAVAVDTPVSTGKASTATPTGVFRITERVREGKISNRYDCPLPFWMRLGSLPVGLHAGVVPGHAASHGCVRLPKTVAQIFFDHTAAGVSVEITRNWTPPQPSLLAAN